MPPITEEDAWAKLICLGVSHDALLLITDVNGYSMKTLEDVLYAHTGHNSFTQV